MQKPPVNLNFFTISFPITAIVSILHRIFGFLLFFAIPFLLSYLQAIMHYPMFLKVSAFAKVVIWAILSGLVYHMFAGIRHIFMDISWFESLRAAKVSAFLVLILSIFASVFLGVKIWV